MSVKGMIDSHAQFSVDCIVAVPAEHQQLLLSLRVASVIDRCNAADLVISSHDAPDARLCKVASCTAPYFIGALRVSCSSDLATGHKSTLAGHSSPLGALASRFNTMSDDDRSTGPSAEPY